MKATMVIDIAPYIAKRDKGKALDPRTTGRTGQITDPFNLYWGPRHEDRREIRKLTWSAGAAFGVVEGRLGLLGGNLVEIGLVRRFGLDDAVDVGQHPT
jgi:hypothetical protein